MIVRLLRMLSLTVLISLDGLVRIMEESAQSNDFVLGLASLSEHLSPYGNVVRAESANG